MTATTQQSAILPALSSPRRALPLQVRLLLAIGGFILIAALTLGTSVLGVISNSEYTSWESRQRDAARAAAGQIEAFNVGIYQTLGFIRQVVTDRAALDATDIAAALLEAQPAIAEAVLVAGGDS
jgi:hypothetical protein